MDSILILVILSLLAYCELAPARNIVLLIFAWIAVLYGLTGHGPLIQIR